MLNFPKQCNYFNGGRSKTNRPIWRRIALLPIIFVCHAILQNLLFNEAQFVFENVTLVPKSTLVTIQPASNHALA
jgi:hypothetical protein